MVASFMPKLFSLPGLPWVFGNGADSKVGLTVAEVEALRSEIADAEEREAHLHAQLEHVDEVLKSSRLAGYLYIRTRWTELPGEPPIIDDTEVDDWLPRFVVLNGSCIFYYVKSTDLSPQDSTLLSDVTEVGWLPSFAREEHEVRSWLTTLQTDCNLASPSPPEVLLKSHEVM